MSPEGNPDCVANGERDEERGRGKEGEVVKEETERKSEKSGKKRHEEQRRENTGKGRNSKGLGSLKNKRTDGYEEEDTVIRFKAGNPNVWDLMPDRLKRS